MLSLKSDRKATDALRFGILQFTAAMLAASAAAQPLAPGPKKQAISLELPEVVVRMTSPAMAGIYAGIKGRPLKVVYPGGWAVLEAGTVANAHRLAAEWQKDSLISYAGVNQKGDYAACSFFPNDPFFFYNSPEGHLGQWHLVNSNNIGGAAIDAKVRVPWLNNWTGSGVLVGIVDDSVEITHPDLAPNFSPENSWDFGQNDPDPSPVVSSNIHGTSVAGVALARGGNGIGVTGAAPYASLAGLRVDFGAQTEAMFAAAIEYGSSGSANPIKIKNHSYGSSSTYFRRPVEAEALASSASAGTIHCWAAGNSRGKVDEDSSKKATTGSPNGIAVAALAPNGSFSSYSSFGGCVFVTAPSKGHLNKTTSDIVTTSTTDRTGSLGYNSPFSDDYTNLFGGTSSASPVAAGVLALVKERVPSLDTRFAKHLLARCSDKVDPDDSTPSSDGGWKTNGAGLSFNQNYGFGLINAERLLQGAENWLGVTPLTLTTIKKSVVNKAIPDSPEEDVLGEPAIYSFSVDSSTPLEEVLVTLEIFHDSRGDLEARLTSPAGTTSRLMCRSKKDGSWGLTWTFTSNAFWGENPKGAWTLVVQDAFPDEAGRWNYCTVVLRQGTLIPSYKPTVSPESVVGGQASVCTLTLPEPAVSDSTFSLAYNGLGVSGPGFVTVPQGSSAVSFTVATQTVDANVEGTIIASIGSFSRSVSLSVERAGVQDVAVSSNPVPNSTNSIGTVSLNGPLTAERTVSLTYSPPGSFAVAPATVTVPAGQSTANFAFRTSVVPAGFAGSITATLNSLSDIVNFAVAPVNLLGCQVYPMNAFAGQRVFGVVRLAAPRAADMTVTVTSSHGSLIPNQMVFVPAGETYGVFVATAGAPPTVGLQWVTLTATGGGETRQEASLVRSPSNLLSSGLNSNYEVGDGITRHREFMSVVRGGEGVLQAVYSKDTLVVLKSNGTVWTVGKGEFGQHGDGTSGPAATKTVLTQVPGLANVREIASNSELAILALTSTGQVYGWGQNAAGQAGKSPFGIVSTPTLIASLSNIVRIGTAATASFALDANGDIWSWGSNSNGAGARGAGGNTAVPVKLTTVAGPFVEFGFGRNFGFAIHANGNLYGWGVNADGQLGLGDFVNRTTMTLVPVSNVRQIGGGLAYSILLRTPPHGVIPTGGNRVVMTTGDNTTGQRGQGAIGGADTNVFAAIINGHGNTNQIGAGNRHAFYVSQGSPRSWGVGSLGERADGTFVANSGTPTILPSTPTVSGILASVNNSTLITQTPSAGRPEAIITDGTNLSTVNLRTNTITNLTGTVPAGHTVVGGGEIAGVLTRNEIITRDAGGALHYMEANGSVLGASTATSVTLGATEVLVGVANMDNAGRMDFVTANTSTGAVVARLYNGTAQTATRNLYTLAANEVVTGVGDFNVDRFQDLLIYNTVTRIFTVRRYNASGTFLGTSSLTNAPNTPAVPTAIPAVPAGLVPVAAAETLTGYSSDLVFVNTGTNAFETWQFSRLNRVATGLVGPVIPGGYGFAGFWR